MRESVYAKENYEDWIFEKTHNKSLTSFYNKNQLVLHGEKNSFMLGRK